MSKFLWSTGEGATIIEAASLEQALRRVIKVRLETADGETPEERLQNAYGWFQDNDQLEEAHEDESPEEIYEGDLGPFAAD
jgi:hypothetical protein